MTHTHTLILRTQVVDTALGAPPVGGASIGGGASSSSGAAVVVAPSALEPTTAELVKTLFDTDMFKTAMAEIKGTALSTGVESCICAFCFPALNVLPDK
jgi:hypothetical protein